MKKFKSKATKMLSSVIAVIMTLTAFSALTPATTVGAVSMEITDVTDGFGYRTLDDGTIEIASCNLVGDVVIPSEIDGKKVTIIGENAFEGAVVDSVSIPETVVEIKDCAFYQSTISSIVFSNGLKKIDEYAFSGCEYLTSVKFPESIEEIGDYAFNSCYNISYYDFPDKGVITGNNALGEGVWYYSRPDGPIVFGKTFYMIKAYSQNYATVDIPDDIEVIGCNAFSGSYNLTSIDLPDSVRYIGSYAFSNSGISEITIPEKVTRIEEGTFSYCTSLENVNFHDNITYIGDYAFSSNEGAKEFELPSNLEYIGDYAFAGSIGVSEFNIPESVTHIGDYAFAYDYNWCDTYPQINIPENHSLVSVSLNSFVNTQYYNDLPDGYVYLDNICLGYIGDATSLTSIDVKDGTTIIADNAFSTFQLPINLPDSVEYIGDEAFNCNSALTELTLPASLKTIGEEAFAHCENLVKVTFPSTLESIGNNAYMNCDKLATVEFSNGSVQIGSNAFYGTSISTINISDCVTSVDFSAFSECADATSIHLGKKVRTIDNYAFVDSDFVTEVTVDSANPYYSSVDGVLYNKKQSVLLYYPPAKTGTKFVFPSGVKSFDENAFKNNTNLTEIEINEGVTNIPDYAFSGCNNVAVLTIPSTVEKIGNYIFSYDSKLATINYKAVKAYTDNSFSNTKSLTTVNFYDGVKYIDYYAFQEISSLENITFPESIEYIGENAFYGTKWASNYYTNATTGISYIGKVAYLFKNPETDNLSITVKNGTKSLYAGLFAGADNIVDVTLPDSVTVIGASVFDGCTGMSNITLSDSLETIERSAFCECYALSEITIPDSVTYIDSNVFMDCTNLEEVTLSNSLEYLGGGAFSNSGIVEIVIPAALKTIDAYAFENCDSLKKVTFSSTSKLETIETGLFLFCYNLTEVVIPDSVRFINESAFSDSGLQSVTIGKNVEIIGNYAFGFCDELTDVTFSENNKLKSIGNCAFTDCDNLSEIVVPEGVEFIGSNAFSYNYELVDISLPSTLTSIGESAFYSCTSLESIEIPSSVTELSAFIFSFCSKLSNVKLNEGTSSIQYAAFGGCTNLNTITIPNSIKSIDFWAFDYDMVIKGYAGSYAESFVETANSDHGFYHTFVDITIPTGDINLDDAVNVKDATLLQKYLVELETLTPVQLAVADVTQNGNVDIKDVSYILKANAGLVELN